MGSLLGTKPNGADWIEAEKRIVVELSQREEKNPSPTVITVSSTSTSTDIDPLALGDAKFVSMFCRGQ